MLFALKNFDGLRLKTCAQLKTQLSSNLKGIIMLGEIIRDPDHIESQLEQMDGLELLPTETVFARDKGRVPRLAIKIIDWQNSRGNRKAKELL